ncbi:hypothetical protein [Streptomyces sp. NPDC021224]|uniref:hypothetical protein n=1 Tax=unclassified Streptomyces TaxID=2593676 RepID=UPI0037A07736
MGFSVLYIAFGIVALWLLGEVLLQYKARLRWRALAFVGFLGVVVGVAARQPLLILAGAITFGIGQAQVTLSHKRGFAAGWALRGGPLADRLRGARPAPRGGPTLQVGPIEEDGFGDTGQVPVEGGPEQIADPGSAREDVYQPMPLHEDSGEYPLYGNQPGYTADPYATRGYGYGDDTGQGAGWAPPPQPEPAAASYGYGDGQGATPDGYGWGGDQAAAAAHGYPEQPPGPGGYGYDQGPGQQQGHDYGDYGQGYPQQPAAGYGDFPHTTGDWTPKPPPPADPYGYGYPYQEQYPQAEQQPYIPQQQPYGEQQAAPPHQPQHSDPYDPYRY